MLKRALEELHTQRHEMLNMDFVCDLGAGLIAIGEHEEALTLTMNAIEAQHRGGKFLYMPALFRMKGLILASRSAEDYSEAEGSLLSAIDWAKRQSATLFELKAATELAELLLKQGRMPEAYKHLGAALDRMPAGNSIPRSHARPANPQPAPIRHQGRRLKRSPSSTVRCLRSRVQVLAFRYKPRVLLGVAQLNLPLDTHTVRSFCYLSSGQDGSFFRSSVGLAG